MYELVLLVCLIVDPDVCRTKRLPFQTRTGLMECLRQGQVGTSQWLEENPRWHIARWRCAPPEA